MSPTGRIFLELVDFGYAGSMWWRHCSWHDAAVGLRTWDVYQVAWIARLEEMSAVEEWWRP